MKIYADGADLESIIALADDPRISGFTTNPTLMRKAGVDDYEGVRPQGARDHHHHPISFEVFADEPAEMLRQARLIASWGDNVYVKIPVTNTAGVSSDDVIRELSADGVHLNVTALMTTRPGRGRWRPPPRAGPATWSRSSPAGSPTPGATPSR